MLFARILNARCTLAFRLTLWYAGIFVFSASVAFVLFYYHIASEMRRRTDNDLLAQVNELSAVYTLQGEEMLQRAAVLQAQAGGERKMFFRLFYANGVVFSSSNMSYWKDIGILGEAVEALRSGRRRYFATQGVPENPSERVRVIYARINGAVIMQMGYSLEAETRLLQVFNQIFVVTMSALLLLAIGVGWFMARRALAGVETVTAIANKISEEDLRQRVPVMNRYSEIDRLAITFNQMLDRIQALVIATRQMNDNIAHDLRSPVARIRGLAEVTLTGARSVAEYAQMAGSTIEECDRLLDMINTMLTISRTESGATPVSRRTVDMGKVVDDACELFRPLAEDRGLALSCGRSDDVFVSGDRSMLQRMVANLLDNAIKYTDKGGRVAVRLTFDSSRRVRLEVADTGIGIPAQDHENIFARFFRGDQSRSQGGSGLGLSLARAIARVHGGDISLKSKTGQGSTFNVCLPAALNGATAPETPLPEGAAAETAGLPQKMDGTAGAGGI